MTRRTAFALAVAALALLPLALIGWNEVQLARGRDVVLRTVPVDPIDLMRGRYVRLRYEISGLQAPVSRTVYVPLRERDGEWVGTYATTRKPEDGVFIRGRATRRGIVYGIETYYADEAEARELEGRAAGGMLVRVSLDPGGQARIQGLEVR